MKDLTVAEILTTPVLTVPEDWPLDRLARLLIDNNVTGVPVTAESGDVVGVVSMTDIVRHSSLPVRPGDARDTHEYYLASAGRQYTDEELRGFRIEPEDETTVRDLMTPMVFEISEGATVQEAAEMMVTGGIHRVLVTRDGALAGIVTALDVLGVVADL